MRCLYLHLDGYSCLKQHHGLGVCKSNHYHGCRNRQRRSRPPGNPPAHDPAAHPARWTRSVDRIVFVVAGFRHCDTIEDRVRAAPDGDSVALRRNRRCNNIVRVSCRLFTAASGTLPTYLFEFQRSNSPVAAAVAQLPDEGAEKQWMLVHPRQKIDSHRRGSAGRAH